jgi:ABC-type transporter Mla subunit MlaD
MESRALYIRVGALILLATAVLVGALLFFGGAHLSRGQAFESYFRETVQGLEVGAAVKYRGVKLGQVSEVGLVSSVYGGGAPNPDRNSQFQQVLVRYIIDTDKIGRNADISAMVAQGMRARLASQGLTGLTYIELDFVDQQRFPPQQLGWTPRDAYLPSMPSTLSQVQDAAQLLLQRIEKMDLRCARRAAPGRCPCGAGADARPAGHHRGAG